MLIASEIQAIAFERWGWDLEKISVGMYNIADGLASSGMPRPQLK